MRRETRMIDAVLLAAISLVLLLPALSAAQDMDSIPITRREIAKDILLYQVGQTAALSNMIAVKTSAGTVVFDALMAPALAKRVRDMIEKDFNGKIACLVNTHGAMDHTNGNSVFEDVPIYGQANIKAEMERMGQTIRPQAANQPAPSAEELKKRMDQARERRARQIEEAKKKYRGDLREFDESAMILKLMSSASPPKAVVPGTLFEDDYVLNVGDKTFEMHHNTPSYSESDIIIHIPEAKTLIVGDIFNKNRIPGFSRRGTDLDSWEKLFSAFLADDSKVEHFIGTHGGGVLTAAEIREQFRYLRKLFEEVKALKASGKTAAEIQAAIPLEQFPFLNNYNPYFYGTSQNIHDYNIGTLWSQIK